MIQIRVIQTPPTYDSDDVIFVNEEGAVLGTGFVPKGKPAENIRLLRCPACGLENHAFSVHSGHCAWCEFDANLNKQLEVK